MNTSNPPSILAFGELLIDFVSTEMNVPVGDAPGFLKAPGGAPANVAAAAAKLGCNSAFMGQVGDDPFGRHLASVLHNANVNTDGLTFSKQARTALAFVSNSADGDRSFMFYRHPSADMLMTPADLNLSLIDKHDAFHYGSITLIHEPAKSALLTALNQATASHKFISYDPNLRLPLWPSPAAAKQGILSALHYASLLKISQEELRFLTDSDDISTLWRDRMQLICVTHGPNGATIHTRSGLSIHRPGCPITARDTTGAGDAFVAAMLFGLLQLQAPDANFPSNALWGTEGGLARILDFANAVGALTCLREGAIPSLPTLAETQAFLAQQQN